MMSHLRQIYGLPDRYFLSLGRMVEKKNLSTLVEAYAQFVRGSVEVDREKGKGKGPDSEAGQAVASSDASRQTGRRSDLSPQAPDPVASNSIPALVFVGSGELEAALEAQARSLGLEVVDRREAGASQKAEMLKDGNAETTGGGDTAAAIACHQPPGCLRAVPPSPGSCHEETRGSVFFHGFRQIEESPIFYALAEVFILPSLYEEWGLVVNEAMASGLPVIVSRTAGCAADLVHDGENGFTFDPGSSTDLAMKLVALASDCALRSRMGAESRRIIDGWGCGRFASGALAAVAAALPSRRHAK